MHQDVENRIEERENKNDTHTERDMKKESTQPRYREIERHPHKNTHMHRDRE